MLCDHGCSCRVEHDEKYDGDDDDGDDVVSEANKAEGIGNKIERKQQIENRSCRDHMDYGLLPARFW